MKTGQLESFLHNVVTLYYDSFESHTFNSHSLCNKLIAWLCDHVSVVLKYKINARQKTYLCFSALLTIPVFFDRAPDISAWNIPSFPSRWQFNLAVKKGSRDLSFSDGPWTYWCHIRVIFKSFCFGDYFKFKREVVWRATSLRHVTTWLEINDCEHEIFW